MAVRRDPALGAAVEALGFDVLGEGRLALTSQRQSGAAGPPAATVRAAPRTSPSCNRAARSG